MPHPQTTEISDEYAMSRSLPFRAGVPSPGPSPKAAVHFSMPAPAPDADEDVQNLFASRKSTYHDDHKPSSRTADGSLIIPESYSGKLLENYPMWHFMGLSGLTNFEKPFRVQLGDVEVARELASEQACTRLRVDPGDEDETDAPAQKLEKKKRFHVPSPFGLDIIEMDRYPFFFSEARKLRDMLSFGLETRRAKISLREFGCSIAMTLYLRFNLEFAAVIVLAFLLSLPKSLDNAERNGLRDRCRVALYAHYADLTDGNATYLSDDDTAWYAECGYSKLIKDSPPLRTAEIETLPGDLAHDSGMSALINLGLNGPLTTALGACEEYSNLTHHRLPIPGFTKEKIFVNTPSASFCGGEATAVGMWCDLLIVLIMLGYLVYLRWRVHRIAIVEDHLMWTTADYAVQVRHLPAISHISIYTSPCVTFADLLTSCGWRPTTRCRSRGYVTASTSAYLRASALLSRC